MLERRIELAEGLFMANRHEHRVIAEASVAARWPNQRPVDAAFEGFGLAIVGPGDREGAGEMRIVARIFALRLDFTPHAIHRPHPVAIAFFILGPAGGVDAGTAMQCIDAQATVVGEGWQAG